MRVKPTMKTLKEIDSEGYALVRIRSRDLSSRHRFLRMAVLRVGPTHVSIKTCAVASTAGPTRLRGSAS
jgi:hypothetical protein